MSLERPHVPWSIRREVIERQMREAHLEPTLGELYTGSDERATRWMIERLFPGERVQLHHRPALINREKRVSEIDGFVWYKPPANDPDHLVYLPADDHDVETRVRGQHGDYSDLALRRKRKRIERKASQKFKRKWPKRKLRWKR